MLDSLWDFLRNLQQQAAKLSKYLSYWATFSNDLRLLHKKNNQPNDLMAVTKSSIFVCALQLPRSSSRAGVINYLLIQQHVNPM